MLDVLLLSKGESAFERLPAAARGQGLGGATGTTGMDPFAFLQNPSALATQSSIVGGASYTPGLFGLRELGRFESSLCWHVDVIGTGLAFSTFGEMAYREMTLTTGAALELGDRLSAGIAFSWYHLSIAGYGAASTFALHVGFTSRLADQLLIAASIVNLNRPTIGRCGALIPAAIISSVEYVPLSQLRIIAGLEKDECLSLSCVASIEWEIFPLLAFRVGENEGLRQCSMGIGISLLPIRFDYAYTIHRELGGTHHLSVIVFSAP